MLLVSAKVKPSTKRELRGFGLVLGALLVAFFGAVPFFRHREVVFWPWIAAALLWSGALDCSACAGMATLAVVAFRGGAWMGQYANHTRRNLFPDDYANQPHYQDLAARSVTTAF